MPIAINGSGTLTGISVGGLPDGIVDTAMLANNAVTSAKSSGLATTNGITMADQWRMYNSQTTSADTLADITSWERNDNQFSGVGSAMTNSGAEFTFPLTGIYHVSYSISAYITSGSTRYVSPRLNFNGTDICHPWGFIDHVGHQTNTTVFSQAILDVQSTTTILKIKIQSQNPVVVIGNQEAGYNSSTNISEVTFIRLGDT